MTSPQSTMLTVEDRLKFLIDQRCKKNAVQPPPPKAQPFRDNNGQTNARLPPLSKSQPFLANEGRANAAFDREAFDFESNAVGLARFKERIEAELRPKFETELRGQIEVEVTKKLTMQIRQEVEKKHGEGYEVVEQVKLKPRSVIAQFPRSQVTFQQDSRNQKDVCKLNDLKKFADTFKLHTPVPSDIVS